MNNDIISAAITTIRNGNMRKSPVIRIPATGTTRGIGRVLPEEGFVKSIAEHKENQQYFLDIGLKYRGRKRRPYITAIRRISKPGLKVYSDHRGIPRILGGMGIAISSTSRGIMTDRDARQKKIGGEIVCCVY
uniref:ribosomal protein S8 n=1 Tax=Lygodium merrillii TaxID=2991877 RepID=UPI002A7FEB46|nr:ribosomal protein S8 [Lygodium merrillii]UYS92586.1 ribosomal protein S8 [Lygodium merrillii]